MVMSIHNSSKTQMVLIILMWGEKAFTRWRMYAAPSYFAPGNIRELAQNFDLIIHIATDATSAIVLQRTALYEDLRQLAPVKFFILDQINAIGRDLGPKLTMSYYHVINSYRNNKNVPYFVFLNGDFILANNSLKTLSQAVNQGHKVIMGPSLRFDCTRISEFARIFDLKSTKCTSIPNRKCVQFVLDNLHPTVVSQTLNNALCEHSASNQLYWLVNKHLLLSRQYLLFTLCFRPTHFPEEVHGYFDYTFVHEFTPGIEPYILNDSDTFFMAEAEDRYKEYFFVNHTPPSLIKIADRISAWSNNLHRFNAETVLYFKGKGDTSDVTGACTQFDTMYQMIKELCKKPLGWFNHPFWSSHQSTIDALAALNIPSYSAESQELLTLLERHKRNKLIASIKKWVLLKHCVGNITHFRLSLKTKIGNSRLLTAYKLKQLEKQLITSIYAQVAQTPRLQLYDFFSLCGGSLRECLKKILTCKGQQKIDVFTIELFRTMSIKQCFASALLFGSSASYDTYHQAFHTHALSDSHALVCLTPLNPEYYPLKNFIRDIHALAMLKKIIELPHSSDQDYTMLQEKLHAGNYTPDVLCMLSPHSTKSRGNLEHFIQMTP